MTPAENSQQVNLRYVLITVVAVFVTWEVHELAHWFTGKAFGYPMAMTLNTAYSLNGTTPRDAQVISAAGPLMTILQAVLLFMLMRGRERAFLYPFLLTCLYCRLLAALVSIINPNDEARISTYLGIGKFTLPVAVSALLFVVVFKISRSYRFSSRFNFINVLLILFLTSAIILCDQFFHLRLI